MTPQLLVLLVLLAGLMPAQPNAWPMFRGPNASGTTAGTPPLDWDMEAGRGVLWSVDVPGAGHSSPVVWGDHVFVTTAVSAERAGVDNTVATGRATVRDEGAQQWQVIAFDRSTGRLRWRRTVREGQPAIGRHPKSTHANSTPATDGRHVVAYFGSEGLHAFDFDGTPLWSRDLGVIDVGYAGLPEYQWGTASSPLIHGGLVIVQADRQQRSFIAAFDVRTGREVWRHDRNELPSWSTPAIADGGGRPVLVTNSPRFVRGLDPDTGRELWRVADEAEVKVPSPVVAGDLVIVSGGAPRGRPFHAIHADPAVPAPSRIAWTAPKGSPYTPTPIVVDDLLYVLSDAGVMSAYETATGMLVYQERVALTAGGFSASPVAAAGRLYLAAEDGTVTVIRSGRQFERLAARDMGELLMATPAISGSLLIVRTATRLVAIGTPRGGYRSGHDGAIGQSGRRTETPVTRAASPGAVMPAVVRKAPAIGTSSSARGAGEPRPIPFAGRWYSAIVQPPEDDAGDVTQLLEQWQQGDNAAFDRAAAVVYPELRRIAAAYLGRERVDHTLQPTALINEAFVRLSEAGRLRFEGRSHFFALAAQLMRRILVDHARAVKALKRGGGAVHVTIDAIPSGEAAAADFLALHDALDDLARLSAQKARLIELRFFGGLTLDETAAVLGVSTSKAHRDQRLAQAWLADQLSK